MKPNHEAMTRSLVDDGRLIEAGWVELRISAIPPNAPQVQLDEMRNAFFAGAQHVFSSIMTMLEPGADPTEKDLERMTQIADELDRFYEDFRRRHGLGDEDS